MQNDIDQSAYVFANKSVVEKLAIKEFTASDVSLNLNEIPEWASVNKDDPIALAAFTDKLKKYNYYLTASLKGEYIRLLHLISYTIRGLQNDYHLEN